MCSSDLAVQRLPSAPRLNVSHLDEQVQAARRAESGPRGELAVGTSSAGAKPAAGAPQAGGADAQALQELQAMYLSAVRHVLQNTEDVGDRFATEARAMHQGDTPAKPIRGQVDDAEREALREEGIEVMTLVVPKGLDGPVQ